MVHGLATIKRINRKAAEDRTRRTAERRRVKPRARFSKEAQANTPWTLAELRSVRNTPEYEVYRQFASAGKIRSEGIRG